MKAPTVPTQQPVRAVAYPRRRSPGATSSRGPSPASRRTSPTSVEMQRQAQLTPAERQLLPLLEREYREDIRSYMYEMQSKTMANVELIDQQPELRWYMRSYLVDFLVEIHLQHRLRPETLYLALNIVDRYVSKRIVFKKHYQLVGCAALWIAAKFEDAKDRVPTLPELVEMCCGAYDEKAFVQMEGHVLETIGWVVGHPSAEAWLRLACVTGTIEDARTQHVARFLMELTLFHREFIRCYMSDVAMASLLLARHMLGKSRRPIDESDAVVHIMRMLDELLGEHLEEVSPVVLKKYSLPCYSRASIFAREWYLCGRRLVYPEHHPSSAPVTPIRSATATRASASSSSPVSSSPLHLSSTPARSDASSATSVSSSDSEFDLCDDDDDDDERDPDQPLTPLTPFSSAGDSFIGVAPAGIAPEDVVTATFAAAAARARKENAELPVDLKAQMHHHQNQYAPAHRIPLEHASWEMNHQQVPPPSHVMSMSPP
ncbi:uncharacterized protein JCM10292_004229 [Rhodotorula paludigena]|uniref:uncharacterized protein n=1 Tax=Rhodotorula paludigena TaxID=86838 RepID=UPI00317C0DEC